MVVRGIAAQKKGREATVILDPIWIVEKCGEAAARRDHPTGPRPFKRRLEHRNRRVVLIGHRLKMDELSDALVPMRVVAMVDHRAHARDDAAVAAGAKRFHVQVRGKRTSPREEIDLSGDVGRPPCIALAIDLKWQPRELFLLRAPSRILDSDAALRSHWPSRGTLALASARRASLAAAIVQCSRHLVEL